jgi:hypothetical protein
MLLRGDWKLEDQGRMDRTHLRWFTPKTYAELFRSCDYEVLSVEPVTPLRSKPRLVSFLTAGRFDYLFTSQMLVTARVPHIT